MAENEYTLDQFGRYVDSFKHLFERWIKQIGLNYHTFAVLYSLGTTPKGCTQKAIAYEWIIPKQTVFNVCKSFQQKGWIEYFESPDDKRERILRLTALGQQQAAKMLDCWSELDRNVMHAFGQAETKQLFASLKAFAETFEKEVEKTLEHNVLLEKE